MQGGAIRNSNVYHAWFKVVELFLDLFGERKAEMIRVFGMVWVVQEWNGNAVLEKDDLAVWVFTVQVSIVAVATNGCQYTYGMTGRQYFLFQFANRQCDAVVVE